MNIIPKDSNGCPFLILAPMEGVGDRCFRKAIASIGGFDEAVRDFLRVPKNAHIKSLASEYHSDEYALDDTIVIVKNEYVYEGFGGIWDILSKDAFDSYYKQFNSSNQLSGGRYRPFQIDAGTCRKAA